MSRAQAATDLVRAQVRPLKMPGLGRAFEPLARQASEEGWTHQEYLYEVLAAELASRAESAVRQRLHAARFPEQKPLDSFDFASADGIDAKLVLELARGEWIARAENVLFAGPIGTGKTHLAIALGSRQPASAVTSPSGVRPTWCALSSKRAMRASSRASSAASPACTS